jgi:hypothetical protein
MLMSGGAKPLRSAHGLTSRERRRASFVRAGRPALPRCTDTGRSGDKMIDGVKIPAGGCMRPLDLQRPSRPCWPGGRVDAGAGRKSICVTMGRGARGCWRGSGGSFDRLLGLVELDGGERLLAELAQDVVGAAAELARDREAGAVVVDPLPHLAEVGVVGGGAASG